MSMIPLAIIIVLIIGAGYFLMKGEFKLFNFNKGIEIVRLEKEGFPSVVFTDKPVEKIRRVLKSQDELNQFLNEVDPTGLTVLKRDTDFNKEYLIAASSSTNSETGRKVKIKRAVIDKETKTLTFIIEETEAGSKCPVDAAKNIAIDIVDPKLRKFSLAFV